MTLDVGFEPTRDEPTAIAPYGRTRQDRQYCLVNRTCG